jgi:hypothetical protein
MNLNTAVQNQGVIAWASAISNAPVDIRKHVNFGFTFHIKADIATEAVFEIVAAPESDADPCLPGAQHPIQEVLTCVASWGVVPADKSTIHIPAGTKAGSMCTATLPCKPDAFVQVEPVSGDTGKIDVVIVLSGPK